MLFDWQTRCLTITEADRPGTLRLSAPMASRERVGHSVNIRRMLSYVEGPSSFKLANKSGPGLHRHDRLVGSFVSSFSLSFVRIPVVTLPPPPSSSFLGETAPSPVVVVVVLFFTTACASSPLARLRVPPSLRLQVARNSLQPPPRPLSLLLPLLLFLPERPSVHPSGRARCENIGSFAR